MRSRFFINRLSRFLFLLLIFTQNHFSTAQENKPHQDGIQVALKKGVLVPHRVVMRHLLQGHANGLTVGWMRQTLQGEEWHHTYRQPQYGVKFNYMDIGNREVLGTSWSIAGNTFIPFWRHNRFAIAGSLRAWIELHDKAF